MNPLLSRKKLLIAESELNRAQLVEEWETMTDEVRSVAHRAKSMYSIASSTAMVVAGLAALRGVKAGEGATKRSWLQTIFKGAGLISTLWMAFRARGRSPD
jgi:hypothetical protein